MARRIYTDAHASVRFWGEAVDPLDITVALRLPPDYTHRTGEPVLRRARSGKVRETREPYPHGMWIMSSRGLVKSPQLSTHIKWLLSELEPKVDAIQALLSGGVSADIVCYSSGASPRLPAIPRSLRKRAEALGLRIEIDHYEMRP